jgi:hypothetical protein
MEDKSTKINQDDHDVLILFLSIMSDIQTDLEFPQYVE